MYLKKTIKIEKYEVHKKNIVYEKRVLNTRLTKIIKAIIIKISPPHSYCNFFSSFDF